jgi:predicted phosphohydrolase
MTTALANHEEHIAELRARVFTLECAQQTCVLQKIDLIEESMTDTLTKRIDEIMKPVLMKVNLFDKVLQDLVGQNKILKRDVETLKFEDHKKMCRNIVDLQQTMSIMKRKRAQSELLQQHRPVTSKENLALIQLRSLQNAPDASVDAVASHSNDVEKDDKAASVDAKIQDLVESLDILNVMHRNLRAELAEMNLVHA